MYVNMYCTAHSLSLKDGTGRRDMPTSLPSFPGHTPYPGGHSGAAGSPVGYNPSLSGGTSVSHHSPLPGGHPGSHAGGHGPRPPVPTKRNLSFRRESTDGGPTVPPRNALSRERLPILPRLPPKSPEPGSLTQNTNVCTFILFPSLSLPPPPPL